MTLFEELDALPEPPKGWQYGVVMDDHRVWACGPGAHGRGLQRLRLGYSHTIGPCLLPLSRHDAMKQSMHHETDEGGK